MIPKPYVPRGTNNNYTTNHQNNNTLKPHRAMRL